MTNTPSVLDPSTGAGTIFFAVLGTVISILVVAVLGWALGPFRWLLRSHRLRTVLKPDRHFRLVYNPEDNKNKIIAFQPDGKIGGEFNNNENRWRIRRGKLEIIAVDGEWYSRFIFDSKSGRLVNTNEQGTRSVHGQFIVPQWKRPDYREPNN